MDSNLKFKIGDEVIVIKTHEKGIISGIQSILPDGNSVYVVDISGNARLFGESYLTLGRDKSIINRIETLDVNELSSMVAIDDKINQIINELNLVSSNNPDVQLNNACKLMKYLVLRSDSEFNQTMKIISKTIVIDDLYNGLVNGYNNYITNSYVFSEILKRVGMDVKLIALKDENEKFYVANLVLIGEKYYYFDVTLEQEIYSEDKKGEFALCCAGIGKKEYEQYFIPMSILSIDNSITGGFIPSNIAENDIDFNLVNGFSGVV